MIKGVLKNGETVKKSDNLFLAVLPPEDIRQTVMPKLIFPAKKCGEPNQIVVTRV